MSKPHEVLFLENDASAPLNAHAKTNAGLRIPHGIVLCAALLSGCHDRERVSESDAAPPIRPARQSDPKPLDRPNPYSSAPLRRSRESVLDLREQNLSPPASQIPVPVVTGMRLENNQILLKAVGVRDTQEQAALRKILESLQFKSDGDGSIWTRVFPPSEAKNIDRKISAQLQETERAETELRKALQQNASPGCLLARADRSFYPGRLVYTGNPLDVAFVDAGANPQWFVAVESESQTGATLYVRGGPLYVSENGMLGLGRFKLSGNWRKVPRDAEQILIHTDGEIDALKTDGTSEKVGRLQIVRLQKFVPAGDACAAADGETPTPLEKTAADSPLRLGHLEVAARDRAEAEQLGTLAASRKILESIALAVSQPPIVQAPVSPMSPMATPMQATSVPLIIYADLPWTEQHLKALGIQVERTPGRTSINIGDDREAAAAALAKVLQVLRLKMLAHDQNLRNAERIRDAENRINPYRRKLIKIGANGEAIEELDPTPFPRTYKPGDPNADTQGFLVMPNVNRAVETAEFNADIEEYKLIRAAMERLAPNQIFPDPIPVPQKTEGQ